MLKKTLIAISSLFVLMNAVGAIDSTNWSQADVGYETSRIKSASESKYDHDEFYDILKDKYQNCKIIDAIES